MEITYDQFKETIQKKLKSNQLLLVASIILALGVFAMNRAYVGFAIAFLAFGILSLPNINRCKKDLIDFRNNILGQTEGRVLDVFPQKEGVEDGTWIIFMDVDGEKEVKEIVVPSNPNICTDAMIKVFHTKTMKIPVKIEMLDPANCAPQPIFEGSPSPSNTIC